jgi:hypothetical protein
LVRRESNTYGRLCYRLGVVVRTSYYCSMALMWVAMPPPGIGATKGGNLAADRDKTKWRVVVSRGLFSGTRGNSIPPFGATGGLFKCYLVG